MPASLILSSIEEGALLPRELGDRLRLHSERHAARIDGHWPRPAPDSAALEPPLRPVLDLLVELEIRDPFPFLHRRP